MTVTLPETLTYGKVVGRFVLAIGDEPTDLDVIPNAVAAKGQISFTKALSITKETKADPPTAVIRSIIPAAIDNNGFLYNPKDPTGPRGIWLVTGVYKVSYSLNTGAIEGHDILVLPEHTIENPMDLINYMRPGGPVLSASQYAELSARIETKLPEIVWDGDILTIDGESSPNLTGPTGPKPSVVWEEDVLVVDGEASPHLTGPIGPKPPVSWDADVLIVDGEASPPLTGRGVVSIELDPEDNTQAIITYSDSTTETVALPVGPKGNDSTVPGPANTLTKGTATTGAAGTSMDFTITGTAPNQTLNLTIPRGDTGSPTAYELRGTGMPNGVVTANPGTYYTDEAGTNGAWGWLKKTGTGKTGWDVAHGDTGPRECVGLINPEFTANKIFFRRVGSTVFFIAQNVKAVEAGSTVSLITVPDAFRPVAINHVWNLTAPAAGTAYVIGSLLYWSRTPYAAQLAVSWTTDKPWPTTLPGTPA